MLGRIGPVEVKRFHANTLYNEHLALLIYAKTKGVGKEYDQCELVQLHGAPEEILALGHQIVHQMERLLGLAPSHPCLQASAQIEAISDSRRDTTDTGRPSQSSGGDPSSS